MYKREQRKPTQDPTHACSAGSFQVLWKERVRRPSHRCSAAPPAAVFFVWVSSLGFVCSSFPVLGKAFSSLDSTAGFLMTTSKSIEEESTLPWNRAGRRFSNGGSRPKSVSIFVCLHLYMVDDKWRHFYSAYPNLLVPKSTLQKPLVYPVTHTPMSGCSNAWRCQPHWEQLGVQCSGLKFRM